MGQLFTLLLLLAPLGADGAKTVDLTPKGIYHAVDQHHRTGVKFYVDMAERNGSRRVAVDHGFRTGDRFTFSFEINQTSYVYIVNRTFADQVNAPASTGVRRSTDPPAEYQSKRIDRVREEVSRPTPASSPGTSSLEPPPAPTAKTSTVSSKAKPVCPGEPRLLFPTRAAGTGNHLQANRAYGIPTQGHYVMDAETGVERLYIVISDKRIDFDEVFDAKNGKVRGTRAAEKVAAKLAEWKANADVELVTKGIVHELEGYGVSRDSSRPAVVEVDLRHFR